MAAAGGGDVTMRVKVPVEDAITDLQLMNLAQEIGPDSWRLVGLGLGFREPEMAHFERDHRYNMAECTYHMLIRWRQDLADASGALHRLRQALVGAKLGAVARQLNRASTYNLDTLGPEELFLNPTKMADFDIRQLRRELEMNYNSHLGTTRLLPWDSRSLVAVDRYFTEIGILLEDTSVRTHTKIPLESHRHDIFTISAKKNLPRHRILLQGNPGSGKSTVVAKLAHDWMSCHPRSSLKDLLLLFALPLQKLNEGSNLGDAIRQHLLPEDSTFTAEAIEAFIKARPNDAMVVLDGLEALSKQPKGDEKGSKVGNLVKIIENRRLMECTVMITSRPSKVAQMKESTLREYTLLEMEGYKLEDIFSYILSYFQEDESTAHTLMNYVEVNPIMLESLCSIPLFLTIICHLWEEDIGGERGIRLGTNCELTDHIIKCLWTHHESKHSEAEDDTNGGLDRTLLYDGFKSSGTFTSLFSSFRQTRRRRKDVGQVNRLPTQSARDTTCRLGKVALEKLLSSDTDLIFQSKDLAYCSNHIEIGIAIGLLAQVHVSNRPIKQRNSVIEHDTSVYFFHRVTMQKCAAVYLASLWKKNHAKFAEILKQLDNKFVVEKHEEILTLACGEDAYVAKEIIHHLSSVSASHGLIMKCFFESPEDQSVDEEMLHIFKPDWMIVLTSPSALTFTAFKYFLKRFIQADDTDRAISKLYVSAARVNSIGIFVEALDPEYCPKLSSVSLAWCDLQNNNTPVLLNALGKLPKLSELTMTGSTVGATFPGNVAILPPGCFSNLTRLELPFRRACADEVLRAIFWSGQFPVMETVNLTIQDSCSDDTFHTPDMECPNIKPPCQLQKLFLNSSSLSFQASVKFAKTLTYEEKLSTLSIMNSRLHPEFFARVGEMSSMKNVFLHMDTWQNLDGLLSKCPSVHHIEINSSSPGKEEVEQMMEIISRVMPDLPQLNTIHVSVGFRCNYTSGDGTVRAFCVSLKKCKKMRRILLAGIKLSVQHAMEIVDTCREGAVEIISLSSCFTPADDLTELRRLQEQLRESRQMVLEFS